MMNLTQWIISEKMKQLDFERDLIRKVIKELYKEIYRKKDTRMWNIGGEIFNGYTKLLESYEKLFKETERR